MSVHATAEPARPKAKPEPPTKAEAAKAGAELEPVPLNAVWQLLALPAAHGRTSAGAGGDDGSQPLQRKAAAGPPVASAMALGVQPMCDTCACDQASTLALGGACQGKQEASARNHPPSDDAPGKIRRAARQATADASAPLPHLDRIQRSFGHHDLSSARARIGGGAAELARGLGAKAFASGGRVGFASAPTLALAAHEAAHLVQQRRRVRLADGLGAPGDAYERQADEAADAVVAGRSAEEILARDPGGTAGGAVQLTSNGDDEDSETGDSGHPEWFYFRGQVVSTSQAVMERALWHMLGRRGLEETLEWFRELEVGNGRPVRGGLVLPFSAHTRPYSRGVRSPLDATNDMRRDAHRERVAPRAIPATRAALAVVLERRENFLGSYEAQARMSVFAALASSRERVEAEQARYGVTEVRAPQVETIVDDGAAVAITIPGVYSMADNRGTRGMAGAARALARRLRSIMNLRGELARISASHMQIRGDMPDFGHAARVLRDPRFASTNRRMNEEIRAYQLERQTQTTAYPILAAYAPDPQDFTVFAVQRMERLGRGANAGNASTLHAEISDKLSNISQTYRNLRSGDLKIWNLPSIIESTNTQVGVDATERRLVADKVEQERSDDELITMALTVMAIGFGILAAIPTGGGSLVLSGAVTAGAVGAAATSTVMAVRHAQDYQIRAAASGTDFDKAQAISAEDPSMFWLALDIVGAVADVVAAGAAFRALRTAVREAIQLRRLGSEGAEDALRRAAELAEGQGSGLGRRVTDGIMERAAGSADEVEDVARWEATVNQRTRGHLVDNPGVRSVYASADDQVRRLLTHCSDLCIIANASHRDVARVRAILDQVQPGPDELGYLREYFHIRRNQLSRALTDLEGAVAGRQGAEALEALRGRLLRTLERLENVPSTLPPGTTADQLRSATGAATGGTRLPRISDGADWLLSTQGRVGVIPRQVADALRGQTFKNFRELREAIWRAVAADSVLSQGFGPVNIRRMQRGRAPFATPAEQTGRAIHQRVFNIHHIDPIEGGGGVYDLDNLIVVSPAYHDQIHYVFD